MKQIRVHDQADLGLERTFQLAASGMSYRLLRSSITTVILALAVAFLVYVLIHAMLTAAVQRGAWEALANQRQSIAWMTHLTVPSDPATVHRAIAAPEHHEQRIRQYNVWLDRPMFSADLPLPVSNWIVEFEKWCGQLDPSAASILLGGRPPAEVLEELVADESQRKRFITQRQALKLETPIGNQRSWAWLIDAWDGHLAEMQMLQARHAQAIAKFEAADARPVLERFSDARPTLAKELSDAGFVMNPQTLQTLKAYARDQKLLAGVQTALQDKRIGSQVLAEIGTTDLTDVIRALAEDRLPTTWHELAGPRVDQDDLRLTARAAETEQRYTDVTEGYEPEDLGTPFGLPLGTLWLVALSLLVCVVGVTNALFMSVTERFSEIATMKCLGATDRSVLQVFVAEALIQGVIGGVLGVGCGVLLAVGRAGLEFGGLLGMAARSWPELLGAALTALGVGVVLATCAAVAPAWIASRLAPMEAMRVE